MCFLKKVRQRDSEAQLGGHSVSMSAESTHFNGFVDLFGERLFRHFFKAFSAPRQYTLSSSAPICQTYTLNPITRVFIRCQDCGGAVIPMDRATACR